MHFTNLQISALHRPGKGVIVRVHLSKQIASAGLLDERGLRKVILASFLRCGYTAETVCCDRLVSFVSAMFYWNQNT